jgi:outer membrane protein OmpA-like peptidoglycan-associated protein
MEDPKWKVTRYIVFFDWLPSIELLPEAKTAIAQAASDSKRGDAVVVLVVGHFDTVGSADYHRALIETRLAVVRFELVTQGLALSKIIVADYGEASPRAPRLGEVLVHAR